MPTYEYECSKGHQFEAVQSMHDEPLKRCRQCRAKVRRLISSSSFILKGGGWYSDGYGSAKPSASGSGGESKSESGAAPAKSDAKTETKPAAKSDSKPSGGTAASTGA